jgi:hypothetical protein
MSEMPSSANSQKRSPKKSAAKRVPPKNEWYIELIPILAPNRPLILIAIDADLRRPLIATVTSGIAEDIFAKLDGIGRRVGYPKGVWLEFDTEIPLQAVREWAAQHHVSNHAGATLVRWCAQTSIFEDLEKLLHGIRFSDFEELDRDLEEWRRNYVAPQVPSRTGVGLSPRTDNNSNSPGLDWDDP